jgi:type I restriction enzyme S subunit
VIVKLKQVRAGMLHDLLSYGLDENGQLRDPIAHPEQFKNSPLGRIPKEWDVVRCREVIKLTSGLPKTQRDLLSEKGGNIPVYGGNGITGYTAQPLIKTATVVIGRVGEYCGKVHLTPELSWVTDNALFIKDLKQDLTIRFLYNYFDWSDLTKLQSATGQPLITQSGVGEVLIPCPKIKEQNVIVTAIESYDLLIHNEQKELLKIKFLKSGLQDDLLTGRVRVPENIMVGATSA